MCTSIYLSSQESLEMSAHFVTSFDIFLIQAITSLIYCYFGNRISSKSVQISDAAYTMEWYNFHPQIQMVVKLIILRSQHEIYFTGCGVIICSLEMYKKVVFYIKINGWRRVLIYLSFHIFYTDYRHNAILLSYCAISYEVLIYIFLNWSVLAKSGLVVR